MRTQTSDSIKNDSIIVCEGNELPEVLIEKVYLALIPDSSHRRRKNMRILQGG